MMNALVWGTLLGLSPVLLVAILAWAMYISRDSVSNKLIKPSQFAQAQADHAPWLLLAIPFGFIAGTIVIVNDGGFYAIPVILISVSAFWFGSFWLKQKVAENDEK